MPTQTLVKKVSGKPVPVLKSRVSTRQFRLSKDAAEDGASHDLQQWLKRKQSVWQNDNSNPFLDKDQLEEVCQNLAATNPQLPDGLVEFSFKDKSFVPKVFLEQHITLLEVESACDHIESPEGHKNQITEETAHATASELIAEKHFSSSVEETENDSLRDGEDEETTDDVDDDESKDTKDEKDDTTKQTTGGKTKKLMNQFNFCERATITYQYLLKNAKTQTKPPTRSQFSDYATQWIIYDSYQEDYEAQERDKEKGKKDRSSVVAKKDEFKKTSLTDRQDILGINVVKKALILERMINQNMFDDILQDFRYYEDPSDEFRNSEGTLLPLWKFQFQEIKKLSVTEMKWNPVYFDLFGVSFGTFNFQKQSTRGCICLWSLKNPSHPEYINHTNSGVMSLDFHPSRAYLVAVGLIDGRVAVYDTRFNSKSPLYESSNVGNKHCGIVWQVFNGMRKQLQTLAVYSLDILAPKSSLLMRFSGRGQMTQVQWGADVAEGELVFYSVSSDGNVFCWALMQNHLTQTLVISLLLSTNGAEVQEKTKNLKDSGTCIALHPADQSLFLIGTEEGFIYKCSTAYLSMYLFTYAAHQMPVHRLDFNKYSPNIFASCSADWSIKVWEDSRKEPLFVFDTTSSVGDIRWAPYSSSVLAAVTLDCKAYVFDLNVDKYRPICIQTILSKKVNKLTKVAFNLKLPVVVVGDDKGISFVLKLSPNLRIRPKIPKKQQGVDPRELEIVKLEKLLSLIREPNEVAKSSIGKSSESSSF